MKTDDKTTESNEWVEAWIDDEILGHTMKMMAQMSPNYSQSFHNGHTQRIL